MNDTDLNAQLDQLVRVLPDSLQGDWVVVPRKGIHKIAMNSMLLGGAIAFLFVAINYGMPNLLWVWPVSLVCMAAASKYIRWWNVLHSWSNPRRLVVSDTTSRPLHRTMLLLAVECQSH